VVGTPFNPNFQLNISKNLDEDEEEVSSIPIGYWKLDARNVRQ
jgi:hypothetical protein